MGIKRRLNRRQQREQRISKLFSFSVLSVGSCSWFFFFVSFASLWWKSLYVLQVSSERETASDVISLIAITNRRLYRRMLFQFVFSDDPRRRRLGKHP